MTYKPLHCWDCGTRVIDGKDGVYTLQTNFRQVRFGLSNGSYCESPFCHVCAEQPWTVDRAKQFERAVNAVDPRHQITITSVEGIALPRVTILEPIQVVQNAVLLATRQTG